MMIKASGRSALILATGLFVCFAGPSHAAVGANTAASAKPESAAGTPIPLNKYTKKYAHRKSGKQALKSENDKKAAADAVADDSGNSSAIPPSVANANAELTSSDVPGGNARAMSARASNILQAAPADAQPAVAETQVVSADQLNDVDRALHESAPATPTQAVASAADTPAAPVAPVLAGSSHDSSTWDQTSLIGKIFIGFGALLTMASAARMFMA